MPMTASPVSPPIRAARLRGRTPHERLQRRQSAARHPPLRQMKGITVRGVAEAAHAQAERCNVLEDLSDAAAGDERAGAVRRRPPCADDEVCVADRLVEHVSPARPDRIRMVAQLACELRPS